MMLAVHSPAPDIEHSHYQDFSPYQINFDNGYPHSSRSQSKTPQPRQYMSTQSQQSQNPSIRLQNPLSFFEEEQGAQQQMLAQTPYFGNNWGSNDNLLNPSTFAHTILPRKFNEGYHNRASSASSSASAGPPSPKDRTTVYPQIAGLDVSSYSPSTFDSSDLFAATRGKMPKALPTPAGTPTQNNFSQADYQHLTSPHDVAAQGAMRRIFQENRSSHDDDNQSYAFSGPQSVSSVSHHNSPATPQTVYEGDYDDAVKNLQHTGFNPQLNSTSHGMPSANFDDFYNTHIQQLPQQQQQAIARGGGLSPFRTSLANRFQAAQLDHVASRTSSPANSVAREKSPFRQDAPLNSMSPMPGQRLGPPQMTAAQYQQNMGNAMMYGQQQRSQQLPTEQPKTVSPKDVELEYHEEDHQTPLFPSSQASQFSLPREESNVSTSSAFGQPNSYYANIPQQGQQFPFVSHQRRQQSGMRSSGEQHIPDFPASLTSMETTASSTSEQDQPSSQTAPTISRPPNTSSDLGAYTCAHQGCSQRFDSSVKLQKHKRDVHRQSTPTDNTPLAAPSASHGHVSSAATIASRNSQSGPHKCDRINPTTGKPCNSIFSRPYDLTRHEDTIHNGRKQKVRCHLCTEEKTFSRNDALTRHMRVVHPEVDWPGKVKRRGRD